MKMDIYLDLTALSVSLKNLQKPVMRMERSKARRKEWDAEGRARFVKRFSRKQILPHPADSYMIPK